eukprot:1353161-Alexandrium_andersonii.AAC.1
MELESFSSSCKPQPVPGGHGALEREQQQRPLLEPRLLQWRRLCKNTARGKGVPTPKTATCAGV